MKNIYSSDKGSTRLGMEKQIRDKIPSDAV